MKKQALFTLSTTAIVFAHDALSFMTGTEYVRVLPTMDELNLE